MINIGLLDYIFLVLVTFLIYVNLKYVKTSHLIKLVILVCICCVFGFVRGYNFGVVDLLISILVYDLLLLLLIQQKPASLPPGPSPLPIIGNILDLGDGKNTVNVFRSLRKKYGNIYSLSLGSYWVVVVNGKENLREIFVKNGEFTSNRPPLYAINIFKNKEDQLASVLTDVFGGGTETTATVIKWTILPFLNNMTVQNKMRQEIEEVVGSGRLPTLTDKPKMPYCEAVILEALRFGNIAPLSLPHLVSEEIIYKDKYVIPKGSVIIPCLDSVAFDETWFPESQVFKPERFIDEKGNLCNQDKIATFSLGRRVCPGESLARMELFLYLTSMVQRFEFLSVEGDNPPPVDPARGILNTPQPYKFRAIPTQ